VPKETLVLVIPNMDEFCEAISHLPLRDIRENLREGRHPLHDKEFLKKIKKECRKTNHEKIS
jgi:hypothetical protein